MPYSIHIKNNIGKTNIYISFIFVFILLLMEVGREMQTVAVNGREPEM